MKATAHVMLSQNVPEVRLEHNGQEIAFSISVFGRGSFQQEYDVFDHINRYWASLPEQHQQAIFNLYQEIHIGLDTYWTKNELMDFLVDKVAQLVDMHDLDMVQDWAAMKSDIQVPDSFTADYTHSIDNNTSREKTYTRSDYMQLVTLSLTLRCMIPIWGEYISNIRQDTGTRFKEFYAFQLLNKSKIVRSIPMEKLKVYIDHIVGEDKVNPNNILNHISSEDFGYWLLALVCIRRLCIGDIRGLDSRANLITFIYQFILQKIRNNDSNFEETVKPKTFDDRTPDSENKISTLERYKIKTNISPGEIVELEYSLRDIASIANRLTYQLDNNMLQRSLVTSQALNNERLLDPQMTLLRWVFKPVISPKGLMYLPKPTIVQAFGALEAVLWARGHKYLALLATSYPVISEREMVVSPMDSKMRVPKELSEELDRLYPYTRIVHSKKSGPKEVNLAAKSIDTLTDNLAMFSWRPTADDSMLQEVFGTASRKLPIKPDIKVDLTRLVIELGSRSWM